MSFADFLTEVPSPLRLLLCWGISVGMALAMMMIFRRQILAMAAAQLPQQTAVGDETKKPVALPRSDLLYATTGFLGIAFSILMGFTLNQFWTTSADARIAVAEETLGFQRSVQAAEVLPAGLGRESVRQGLADYAYSVESIQWPLLKVADSDALHVEQSSAAKALSKSMSVAAGELDEQSAQWTRLTDYVDAMLVSASNRGDEIPVNLTPMWLTLVGLIGAALITVIIIFRPTTLGTNIFIVALLTSVAALLMYALVEISNPFLGSPAIPVPALSSQLQ